LQILEKLHQNFGGKGPDGGEEGLHLKAKYIGGHCREMEVCIWMKALTPYTSGYEPQSGVNVVGVGFVEVMVHAGTNVTVQLSVHDCVLGGGHIALPEVAMSFFDVDQDEDGAGKETVTVHNEYSRIDVSEGTAVDVLGPHSFTSTGGRVSRPVVDDSSMMTEPQRKRAVQVGFDHLREPLVVTLAAGGFSMERHAEFLLLGAPFLHCQPTAGLAASMCPSEANSNVVTSFVAEGIDYEMLQNSSGFLLPAISRIFQQEVAAAAGSGVHPGDTVVSLQKGSLSVGLTTMLTSPDLAASANVSLQQSVASGALSQFLESGIRSVPGVDAVMHGSLAITSLYVQIGQGPLPTEKIVRRGGLPAGLVVVLILLGMGVAGALVIALYRRRRRPAENYSSVPPRMHPGEGDDEDDWVPATMLERGLVRKALE
jgi:hypothetical protein